MEREEIELLKSGDEGAFRALVESYQNRVKGLCFRFLRNAEDAEDVAQDVFVEVYRGLRDFRGEAELGTWIYRIATTKSLDAIRRKGRRKRRDAPLPSGASGPKAEPVDETADPEREVENRERALVLQKAVADLPEKQRLAVTLSKYEEMGNPEIAAVLGTTVDSVESLLHRGQRNLRKILTKYYSRRLRRERPEEPPEEARDDV